MLGHVLHVDAVGLETAIGPHLLVLVAVPLGEAKLLADEDLLPAGELELAPPQGLDNLVLKECVNNAIRVSNFAIHTSIQNIKHQQPPTHTA